MAKVRKIAAVVTLGKVDWRDADKRAARNSKKAARSSQETKRAVDAAATEMRESVEDLAQNSRCEEQAAARTKEQVVKLDRKLRPYVAAYKRGILSSDELTRTRSALLKTFAVSEQAFASHSKLAQFPTVASPTGRDLDRSASPSLAEELVKLGQLHADGVLSDEEFALAKARVLG